MIEETTPRTGPGADLAESSSNKECERGQTRRSPCQRLASLPNREAAAVRIVVALRTPFDAASDAVRRHHSSSTERK